MKWSITCHLIKKRVGELLSILASHKDADILEGNLRPDHVHMLMSIPPKHKVCDVIGYMKGKSALKLHNEFKKSKGIYGKSFWSKGYYVSTTGADSTIVKEYIQKQHYFDKQADGNIIETWGSNTPLCRGLPDTTSLSWWRCHPIVKHIHRFYATYYIM